MKVLVDFWYDNNRRYIIVDNSGEEFYVCEVKATIPTKEIQQ